jgi:hypothetical protein
MFDLERSIAQWRRQMLSAGIAATAVLDELESHLREDVENQVSSGTSGQQAFETTVRDIGQSDLLKNEFAKVGGTAAAHVKHFVLTLAGIPDQYLDTNMNSSSAAIEPRWATYLKAAAFLLPAVGLWMLNMVFVLPKFEQLCNLVRFNFPWLRTAIALSNAVTRHFLLISIGLIVVLALLEWRAHQWPRYRRAVFGILSFVLNFTVLIALTSMGILSIVAAFDLAGPRLNRFADVSTHISPFTMVRFAGDKVAVTYAGVDYELATVNDVPTSEMLAFCRKQYGDRLWKKRIAQDLVIVLADMGHPVISVDHTVALTLVDPTTGQQKTVKNAPMTEENRDRIPDTWE